MQAMFETLPKGRQLYQHAKTLIPGGVFGFHKLMADPSYPSFFTKGEGAWVEDVDGLRYLDFVMGKGPLILGYRHPKVQAAAQRQLDRGNILSMTTPDVPRTAELLLNVFPQMEKVRFHKTGSEACSAATRLARAYTGKPYILSAGYHGWHDWCSPSSAGVPPQSVFFDDFHYDLGVLEQLLDQHTGKVAAIFLEPQPALLNSAFYFEVQALAKHHQCLLIMDEIKTGLRMVGGSVQTPIHLAPDMTLVSKAIANGFCLSALLGRADILDLSEKNHISSTFDIEATPFAAAVATLEEILGNPILEKIDTTGNRLIQRLNQCFQEFRVPAKAFGPGAMFRIGFAEPEFESLFYKESIKQGLLFYPFDNQFLSSAHGLGECQSALDAVERTLSNCLKIHQPNRGFDDIAHLEIHAFSHRKGFLAGAPGPGGR